MRIEEIDVYIAPDGEVRIEVRCVPGTNCQTITAPLEQALGGDIVSRELTADADLATAVEASVEEEVRRRA